MTLTSGTGYALIALGPAGSLFLFCIVSKPFLILTLLASTLSWLITLILIAALWRLFLPSGSAFWVYIPLLLSAVAFQEVTRLLFWQQYRKLENVLNQLADRISKPHINVADKLDIALAFGLGHGLSHAVFFCLSLLTPAFGPGTMYMNVCPQMPLFLVIALTALGILLIHTFSMIIAFNGYSEGKRGQQIFVPCMHFIVSLLTLINLIPGGCILGVTSTLSCAIVTLSFCWKVIWDKTGNDVPQTGGHRTRHMSTGL